MTNTSGDAYPLADTMTTTVAAHDGATVLTVAGEVDLATAPALENAIDAILSGKPAAKHGGGAWTPRDALHDAGRVLQVAGGVALIALAVLLPIGLLALLALPLARTLRRRRRETVLDQL